MFVTDKTLPAGLMVQLVVVLPDGKLSSVVGAKVCASIPPSHDIDNSCSKNYLRFIDPTLDFLSETMEIAQRDNIYFVDDYENNSSQKNIHASGVVTCSLQTTLA